MKTYLVGGAVRDQLLGLPVKDKDWVVVGANPEQLIESGYSQVGKGFPVFLHPDTKEEYALARKERKIAKGHSGFDFEFDSSVTLEEDLLRRDLTINAIAKDDNGDLVDPYNGQLDIENKVLRHVSNAFIEDPLRVLRVARFHARFAHLGFSIAEETLALMKTIANSGELSTLAAERVWCEFEKGLSTASPDTFISSLYRCNALTSLLPQLDANFRKTDNYINAEAQVGKRIQSALTAAAQQEDSLDVRWAIVCHALSPSRPSNLPTRAVQPISESQKQSNHAAEVASKQCGASKTATHLAVLAEAYTPAVLQANKLNPSNLVQLLDYCDAWRRPAYIESLLKVASCLAATSENESSRETVSKANKLLQEICVQGSNINANQFVKAGLKDKEIGDAINNARKMIAAEMKKALT